MDLTTLISALLNALDQVTSLLSGPMKTALSWWWILIPGAYLCLVRSLRWRRYNAIHRQYQAKFESGTLTLEDAQHVCQLSLAYDMPLLMNYAVSFALFKTYGIPSISKLLVSTKEFKMNMSRRYVDTEAMTSTFIACPINGFTDPENDKATGKEMDPRSMIALARTNWIHSRFNISNDDYLFTLCMFMLEPSKWANRFGWRSLSPLESYSYFIFWREIGVRMGIKDIPETMEENDAWSQEYEIKNMVPAKSNAELSALTKGELLYMIPESFGIRNFFARLTVCLLQEHVRVAMMDDEQPLYFHLLTHTALHFTAFIQRWLMLPRIKQGMAVMMDMPKDMSKCPRMRPSRYPVMPWYKPERSHLRFIDRLLVKLGVHSDIPSPKLHSNGYRLEEMGPVRLTNLGHEEVMKMAGQLLGQPVTGPFSLEGRS